MFYTVLLTSQVVMVQSLQSKGREFESTYVLVFFLFCVFFVFLPLYELLTSFIIDVPHL